MPIGFYNYNNDNINNEILYIYLITNKQPLDESSNFLYFFMMNE